MKKAKKAPIKKVTKRPAAKVVTKKVVAKKAVANRVLLSKKVQTAAGWKRQQAKALLLRKAKKK